MTNPLDKLLVTAKEAAKMLSISARLLWSLTASREIPVVRIGRRTLYSPTDLQAWIDARRETCSN